MGRLERKLDIDLIAKIENGWKPHLIPEPVKRQKPIRTADSYRGTRRNSFRSVKDGYGTVIVPRQPYPGIDPTGRITHPEIRQNRSKHWKGKDASYN